MIILQIIIINSILPLMMSPCLAIHHLISRDISQVPNTGWHILILVHVDGVRVGETHAKPPWLSVGNVEATILMTLIEQPHVVHLQDVVTPEPQISSFLLAMLEEILWKVQIPSRSENLGGSLLLCWF